MVERDDHQRPSDMESTETILVVEDDPNVRTAVVQILIDIGCNIVEAEDGDAALSVLADRSDINILFTDIVLPGELNGPDIADRARKFLPGPKVLYSTGYSNTGGRGEFSSDANSWILQKPYSAEELMDTLSEVRSA
jgi:CheY-like chemotaxis protein